MKKSYTARVDEDLMAKAGAIWRGSFNSLIQHLLEEYIVANRTDIEKLEAREKELNFELLEVRKEIEKQKKAIVRREMENASDKTKEAANDPLETVRQSITRILGTGSIQDLIRSPYFSAYKKKLDYTDEQIMALIFEVATPQQKEEYLVDDVTMTSLSRGGVSK